jgi:hypothetical protein
VEQALAILEHAFGPNHPNTRIVRTNLTRIVRTNLIVAHPSQPTVLHRLINIFTAWRRR